MIKNLIETQLYLEKFAILKGNLQGAVSEFIEPIKNTTTLWNFAKDPIFKPYLIVDAYVIISKHEGILVPPNNPYYDIQILFLFDNKKNILEVGTGIITDSELKFNQTETQTLIGNITYNNCKDTFSVVRFSTPPSISYIDSGEFNIISIVQFEQETGIKV